MIAYQSVAAMYYNTSPANTAEYLPDIVSNVSLFKGREGILLWNDAMWPMTVINQEGDCVRSSYRFQPREDISHRLTEHQLNHFHFYSFPTMN